MSLLGNLCPLYVFAKLGHPAALALIIAAGKVCSHRAYPNLLEYYNRPATKKDCPGILSFSSKTRKPMKMSTSTSKKITSFLGKHTGGFFSHLRNHQISLFEVL